MNNSEASPSGLVESHGVLVVPGKIVVSDFLREVIANADSKNYDGTFDELVELIKKNFERQEPGDGSVDGDVILVSLPTEGFYTNIVPIDESNAPFIETVYKPRVEGEAPVAKQILRSRERIPASFVKVVLYRADTLERDGGRSGDAEWEVVAILSQPSENVPMHPTTMLRNYRHEHGGTYREYSAEQWANAYEFWSRHVRLALPESDE